MKKILSLILIFFAISLAQISAEELRTCAKCGNPALSDTWNFCPNCGTKLTAVQAGNVKKTGEIELGNIYKNYYEKFSIERPSEEWTIVTKKNGIEKYNKAASVLFILGKDYYCMVIAENLPDAGLERYLELVRPSIENRITISQENFSKDDYKGIKVRYQGEINSFPLIYYQTVLAKDNMRYQILFWFAKSSDSKRAQNYFAFFENSFKVLQ